MGEMRTREREFEILFMFNVDLLLYDSPAAEINTWFSFTLIPG